MRARVLFGGLLPVALAACSAPPGRPALERKADATLSTRPDLVLAPTAGTDVPVVSNLELNLPKSKPEHPRAAKPRRKVAPAVTAPTATEPVAPPVAEPAEVAAPHDHAARPDSAPPVVATATPSKVEEAPGASAPSMQPSPEPVPFAGGRSPLPPDDGMDGGRPARRPGVIIVRGGDGSGHDPCDIHDSGRGDIGGGGFGGIGRPAGIGMGTVGERGAGGVLINDRMPPIGGGYPRGGIR